MSSLGKGVGTNSTSEPSPQDATDDSSTSNPSSGGITPQEGLSSRMVETKKSSPSPLDTAKSSPLEPYKSSSIDAGTKSPMRRMVPIKGYKLRQQVEEKFVEERKSVRTGSPRRRKATLLHFASVYERPDVARVQLLLSNISDRPLQFKLKCEPGPNIAALPSARGRIDGHGSAKCVLTWRREPGLEKWSDAQQPRMLLVLDFLGDKTTHEKRTLTRLIGKVTPGQECDPDKPPVEQLMLDAAASEQQRSTSTSREQAPVMARAPARKQEEKKEEAKPQTLAECIADWLSRQSRDSLIGLLLLILFFYFLGTVSGSKRRRYDE